MANISNHFGSGSAGHPESDILNKDPVVTDVIETGTVKNRPGKTGPGKNKAAPPLSATDDKNVEDTASKTFSDEEIAHLRQLFLQAENALKNRDELNYFILSEQLKDYPLYPYLQYRWLLKHLDDQDQIEQFLQDNKTSRYADKLKRKWLRHLGKRKQWSLILQHPITTKDSTLNCYYHRAQFNAGNKIAALYGARSLWVAGHSQPKVCDPLFSQLKKSELFTQDLRWQRFEAALKNNKKQLASYISTLMPEEHQTTAQLWLKLHRNPARYTAKLISLPETGQTARMFRHAIDRLAGKDIGAAIELWDANKERLNVEKDNSDKEATARLERRLAFKLAFQRDSGAYQRFSQLNETDNSSRTWRVRVALSEQNWRNVLDAIDALSAAEQQQEKWQYWRARAFLETDEVDKAQELFSGLSTKRSFYGYLAADKVNSLYQLADNPIAVTIEEIDQLKNQKEFRVAFELMILERKNEAKLQWWHAVRSSDKDEIIIAAKLAQRWQWHEIAIFTVAKAKHWDDVEMRFPLSFADKIQQNSAKNNLNPALIFGLVRRESAFNEDAHSPVGARGLMQIMPKTGRQIARHFKERWRGGNSLYNPDMNIRYGAYYYQKLLTQFDGHYALALAAYNAGPSKVKKWLPEDKSMPADIWIETIPYKETREYVSAVLAYTLIYQQRARIDEHENALSMNEFTKDIEPSGSGSRYYSGYSF
ncbi:MAG: transglycosylase SLT domain-containing protein [Proteobacteria bacterium]|nr:transglycosylase SLT domain-containing protein [Pseudomonadota bacterium]